MTRCKVRIRHSNGAELIGDVYLPSDTEAGLRMLAKAEILDLTPGAQVTLGNGDLDGAPQFILCQDGSWERL